MTINIDINNNNRWLNDLVHTRNCMWNCVRRPSFSICKAGNSWLQNCQYYSFMCHLKHAALMNDYKKHTSTYLHSLQKWHQKEVPAIATLLDIVNKIGHLVPINFALCFVCLCLFVVAFWGGGVACFCLFCKSLSLSLSVGVFFSFQR